MKIKKIMVQAILIIPILQAAVPLPCYSDSRAVITVFAAASTTNAAQEAGRLFEKMEKVDIRFSFASSSTLARQIHQGAPAQVYISANTKWMNYLVKNQLIQPKTLTDLLGNRIALITPLTCKTKFPLEPGTDLSGILGQEKLAMGDPDHVPAGIYGKQALAFLGMWEAVARKTARTKDVRAALALVERGEAPLGLVYATDAAISKKVKVAVLFPEHSHPPIVYPAALVKGLATPEAEAFLKFLKGPEASAIFLAHGFVIP